MFNRFRILFIVAVVVLLAAAAGILFWPMQPAAIAVASLDPGVGRVNAGQQFTEQILIKSSQPANAVDLTVHYAIDELEVVSSSSKQSRFDMVLFPPKVDAGQGVVRFIQATAAPFSGDARNGLVGTITFKAKRAGQPHFTISGKIVANDSKGTDLAQQPASKPLWKVLLGR
jgi:hypothetical protein